ncbi:ead/Ea22-like family protein [Salmonella enterica]|nr:ead/Ea22-like family protein [Salmonella enterica]
MSNIDKQALREAAERAIHDDWGYGTDIFHEQVTPSVVLSLLDENLQLQREKDAIEAVALALRDDMRQAREQLEAAEKRNAEQQRSLDHRKFLLLSADEVQRDFAEALGCAGDNESIMEAIDDLKQHIAELESKNGNLRTIAHDQNELAIKANLDSINDAVEMDRLHKRIAELEAREVTLPAEKFCPSEYAGSQYWEETEVWNQAISACAVAVRAAGIGVKGE